MAYKFRVGDRVIDEEGNPAVVIMVARKNNDYGCPYIIEFTRGGQPFTSGYYAGYELKFADPFESWVRKQRSKRRRCKNS